MYQYHHLLLGDVSIRRMGAVTMIEVVIMEGVRAFVFGIAIGAIIIGALSQSLSWVAAGGIGVMYLGAFC